MRVVLYEGPGARPLGAERRGALLAELLEAGHAVSRPAEGRSVAPLDGEELLVLGAFEDGATPEVEPTAEAPRVEVQDIGQEDAGAVAARVASSGRAPEQKRWMPWFPVIDYQRCTNCMQCLSFCLFDVYGVDERGQIEVRNEEKCKTNCPACSRVCPEVAILFPKYGKGPINGDIVRATDVQNESMKVDISALLGGDIYASLRQRRDDANKRFSTERDESRALLERKRCLKKLKKDLDIPDEVLMSLPSAGDIQERAERAKAKMEKRMARSQTVKDTRPEPTEDEWGI